MEVKPMSEDDRAAVDALVDRCFDATRRGRTAELLRAGSAPILRLSFVARDGGGLVGAVRCHPVAWVGPSGRPRRLVLLGPLVTAPERRGEGIGLALLAKAAAALDREGLDCMLIGDAPYYGREGWSAEATGGWGLPGPVERERLLLRTRHPALYEGAARLMPAGEAGIPEAA